MPYLVCFSFGVLYFSCCSDIPHLEAFLHAIYNCDYAKFFREMIALLPAIGEDKYLSVHMSLLVREYKILAFSQYLEAYKRQVVVCICISITIFYHIFAKIR